MAGRDGPSEEQRPPSREPDDTEDEPMSDDNDVPDMNYLTEKLDDITATVNELDERANRADRKLDYIIDSCRNLQGELCLWI